MYVVFGLVLLAVVCALLIAQRSSSTVKWHQKLGHGQPHSNETDHQACPMSNTVPLESFDWKSNDALKLRPFKPIYHITMGIRNSTPDDLVVMDRNYLERVLTRRDLIQAQPEIVRGVIPSGRAAVDEVYAHLLADYLPARFPTMFELAPDRTTCRNLVTGMVWETTAPSDPLRALEILGETIEDDMFLLQQEEKGHRSVAYVACNPSGFDPSQKLDKLLDEIHEPVPSYEKIGPSMERFFAKLQVGKPVNRVNWAVVDSPVLFNCGTNHIHVDKIDDSLVDQEIDITKARFRCELQTLTRLPQTQAILFSIKTHTYTLQEIKDEGLATELADAIEGIKHGNAPGMWVYKGAVRWSKSVQAFLRA